MTFFDTIISEVSLILSHLSGITGLAPIVLICAFALLLVLFTFGLFIFIELKRTRKILMEVNRGVFLLGQESEQLSPESNITKISDNKRISDLNQHKARDRNRKLDDIRQARTAFPDQDRPLKHSGEGLSSKLPSKNIDHTTNINIENFSDPITSNTELKSSILELIKASDLLLSLNHIAKSLSGKQFDGNYHPLLNELNQLEKEGQIEGTSKGGKVYYRMK